MDLRIAYATDIGRNPHREMNEDSVLFDELPLVAVADGMGGHEAGEVASNLAVETLRRWKPRLEGTSGTVAAELLKEAFVEINREVFAKGASDEALTGMGTTLTAGWITDDSVTFAHVGDSRLYLLRGTNLQQLTEDQTVAQELVRRGRLREDELESSPQRHYLLQAIGVESDLDIATSTVKLRPADRLIFASDGLYGMLQDPEEIKQILLDHPDSQAACEVLVEAANVAGGHDNISVLIVDVPGDPSAPLDDDDEIASAESGSAVAPPGAPLAGTPLAPAPKSRSSARRWIVLALAVALLAAMAVVFVLRPATRSLVVATRAEQVVVLEGRTGRSGTDPASGKVVHTFQDETVDEFPTTVQRELRSGIVVESLAEARAVVERLPRKLGPADTPTPEPTSELSPKPSPKPSKNPSPSPEVTKNP